MAEEKPKTEKTKPFYHYTDPASAQKILDSGKIKANDGVYGHGAYLTSKPPTEGKANISRNNYDNPAAGYWESREAQGSVDVGIRVHVPEGKLERVTESRDVWVHRGDLPLSDHKHDVVVVGKPKGGSKSDKK